MDWLIGILLEKLKTEKIIHKRILDVKDEQIAQLQGMIFKRDKGWFGYFKDSKLWVGVAFGLVVGFVSTTFYLVGTR